ncbi:hypothetical protein VE03_08515 [Pseudogymnoascus sp. 23342-1-I1]|nr:hypothetical protein VE03_08515 [Pseudogymnoascus sp. 23342-1-I1]
MPEVCPLGAKVSLLRLSADNMLRRPDNGQANFIMSFGFSVSDFITAIQLANKIRKEFVDAPSQFKAVSDELRTLSIVLQDADVAFSKQDLNDGQKRDLEDIDKGCQNVLNDLQRILDKNTEFNSESGSVGKRIQRVWKRLKWDPEDINKLRSRISTHIGFLNAFNGLLTRDNVVKLVRHQEDQDRQTVLDWITLIDYAPQLNDFLTRRQEGTGQWLLDSTEYQTWVETNKQTLFCPGIPGAGKTILTSIVVEELTTRFQNNKSIGIAYLYCNFRRQHEQKAEDLLASLLKQLTQGRSSLPDTIKSLYDRHQVKRTRLSFGEISRALQSVVTLYSRVFIVIDALDECQVSHNCQKTFLSELFSLQAKCGVNLFATSRFIPEITENFQGSISLEIRASENDVRRYVEGYMAYLPSFVGRSPDLQEDVKTGIVKAVDGMFLLAQLHLNSLVGKRSPKAIRAALKILPSGSNAYDHAYKDAMVRIERQVTDQVDLAKQVLSWIICAERPLTTLELQHALAVEVGESKLDEDNLPEIKDMVAVCAGLVTIDEESNAIRLVHYTTQEYFERTQSHWFPNAKADTATICISYLSFDVFEREFCQTDDEFEELLRSNQFFEYAARNWGHHARKASTFSQALSQTVVNVLTSKAKVNVLSQGLFAIKNYSLDRNYSQRFPRRMTGLHLTACFGVETVVKLLLDIDKVDADSKDEDGQTALFWAARNGHKAVVKLLLDSGKIDADSKNKSGQTPLLLAARIGHEAVVKLLLDTRKVDADSKDEDGQTPLSRAAWNGHKAVVKLLLYTGKVDADSKDEDGQTALFGAARNGHEAVVKLLLDTGKVDADSKDEDGVTPLLFAALNGHEAVVKLLLETRKVDPI